MNEKDKEVNRSLIQSMNKKITFLKNPRTIKNHKHLGPLAKEIPYRVVPEVVVFTDYEEGGKYEIPVTITNISGILRRIQLNPPGTQEFSIDRAEYPQ
jgi:hypothetical protein